MNTAFISDYVRPDCAVIRISAGALLCASNDSVDSSFTTPRFGNGDLSLS